MLTALLVCSLSDDNFDYSYDYLVGVDKGALLCASKGLMMDMAVGDFDSIHPSDLDKIKQHAKHVVMLNQQKDESDSEVAVTHWVDRVDKIILIGGLGGRLDHQYVNLQLMFQYPKIHLIDDQNHMFVAQHSMEIEREHFDYLSLFALEPSLISLKHVKYPLDKQTILPTDRYTLSNEFLDGVAHLIIEKGKLLIIKSRDK
jgi:thiamine pyrophosphokinase